MLLCMMIMCLNSLAFFCFLSGEWPTCSQGAEGGGEGAATRRLREEKY